MGRQAGGHPASTRAQKIAWLVAQEGNAWTRDVACSKGQLFMLAVGLKRAGLYAPTTVEAHMPLDSLLLEAHAALPNKVAKKNTEDEIGGTC